MFTKISFLLSAPYASPPSYSEQLEKICHFVRAQDCLKVGMVVMNLICEGLVEEVFMTFYQNNIAPELFEIILADEHRHVCEADLYGEIGLPDKDTLVDKLQELEELLIATFTLQPKYSIALSSLLGPQGTGAFLLALHEKHMRQLKKIHMTPSKKWELLFQLVPYFYSEVQPHLEEINEEINLEIREIEMTSTRKFLMTQLNAPGDPTMVAQFNIDISSLGFYENKYTSETLTVLMMQAVSSVLAEHSSFRNFLSFKKMYQSRGAFVSFMEKIPDCEDHIGSVYFKDCHTMSTHELSAKIKRAMQMMTYCYKKREQIEKEHPELKSHLDNILYDWAHDLHPWPTPGNYSVYLSNIGTYGYTQAKTPLLKPTGLHILLLAVERKPVWNDVTQQFEPKDVLPVSISADTRIFDGLLPIPDWLNKAFQTAVLKMQEEELYPTHEKMIKKKEDKTKLEKMFEDLLNQNSKYTNNELIINFLNQNKKLVIKEAKKIFGEELEIYGERLTQHSDLKNLADNLLLDYLGFDAEKAAKDEKFTQIMDKLLSEDIEQGYRILVGLQTVWVDYVDVEAVFEVAYQNISQSRLYRLSQFIPSILKGQKLPTMSD